MLLLPSWSHSGLIKKKRCLLLFEGGEEVEGISCCGNQEIDKGRASEKESLPCRITLKHLLLLPFTVWQGSQKHKVEAVLSSPSREEQGDRSRFCSPVEFSISTDFWQTLGGGAFYPPSQTAAGIMAGEVWSYPNSQVSLSLVKYVFSELSAGWSIVFTINCYVTFVNCQIRHSAGHCWVLGWGLNNNVKLPLL